MLLFSMAADLCVVVEVHGWLDRRTSSSNNCHSPRSRRPLSRPLGHSASVGRRMTPLRGQPCSHTHCVAMEEAEAAAPRRRVSARSGGAAESWLAELMEARP